MRLPDPLAAWRRWRRRRKFGKASRAGYEGRDTCEVLHTALESIRPRLVVGHFLFDIQQGDCDWCEREDVAVVVGGHWGEGRTCQDCAQQIVAILQVQPTTPAPAPTRHPRGRLRA